MTRSYRAVRGLPDGIALGLARFLFPFPAKPIADTSDPAFAVPEWESASILLARFGILPKCPLLTTPAGMPANATWKVALPFVICKRVRQDFSAECNNRDERVNQ
jgi:hypothetical protein